MKCKQPVFCDVDDTLVYWTKPDWYDGPMRSIECEGILKPYAINWEMIEQIKKHKARGHTVIVWSAGGSQWAEAVVEDLELGKWVDLTLEKPRFLYDDLNPVDFMPKASFMGRKNNS